jgi:hypothetical protein
VKESSPPALPVTSASASSTSERPSITNACSYCNKPGHRWERCFKRLRSIRKSSPTSSSSHSSHYDLNEALPFSSQGQANSQRSRFNRTPSRSPARSMEGQSYRARSFSRSGQSSTRMNLERPPFTCLIHGPSGHPSEECRVIQRLQRQHTVTLSGTQSNFCPRHFSNDVG